MRASARFIEPRSRMEYFATRFSRVWRRGMLAEARRFAAWHPQVIVKVPSTPEGWAAVMQLKGEGIRTNVTLCFSATQALFAALAGADIISPFVGRLDDIAGDGMQVVRDTVAIYCAQQLPTLVLAASIRDPRDIIVAAKAGADAVQGAPAGGETPADGRGPDTVRDRLAAVHEPGGGAFARWCGGQADRQESDGRYSAVNVCLTNAPYSITYRDRRRMWR